MSSRRSRAAHVAPGRRGDGQGAERALGAVGGAGVGGRRPMPPPPRRSTPGGIGVALGDRHVRQRHEPEQRRAGSRRAPTCPATPPGPWYATEPRPTPMSAQANGRVRVRLAQQVDAGRHVGQARHGVGRLRRPGPDGSARSPTWRAPAGAPPRRPGIGGGAGSARLERTAARTSAPTRSPLAADWPGDRSRWTSHRRRSRSPRSWCAGCSPSSTRTWPTVPLVHLDAGWDNVIYRLGADLLVRLPRRAVAAPLIEQRAALAPRARAAPAPADPRAGPHRRAERGATRGTGRVTPWFAGPVGARRAARRPGCAPPSSSAASSPPCTSRRPPATPPTRTAASRWPSATTRGPRCPGRPARPGTHRCDRGPACWEHHLAARAVRDGPALWLHGDLHPHNVIVHEGAVAAVIDFGDITAGDPATDLAIAWMLFAPEIRPVLRDAAGRSTTTTWDAGPGLGAGPRPGLPREPGVLRRLPRRWGGPPSRRPWPTPPEPAGPG